VSAQGQVLGKDFSKYKIYKWVVQVPNVQYPNSILDDQIKQAIDAQVTLKMQPNGLALISA